jgi:predicted small lipoprotein YifL
MSNVSRILVSVPARRLALAALVVGALAGCGQKGPLFLPSDTAAPTRATLPQTLNPAASTANVPTTTPGHPITNGPSTGTGTAQPIPGQ